MKSFRSILFGKAWFNKKTYNIATIIIILALLPLIYGLVYSTGGIKYVYSHTMYIPILLAGIFINPSFAMLVALIGGLLLGPLMPYDVSIGDQQAFFNWFYRLFIFMILGGISGFSSQFLRIYNQHIKHLLTHHQHTKLPNINALDSLVDQLDERQYFISTLLIHNSDQISDVLGLPLYFELLKLINNTLKSKIIQLEIVQSDHNKLWLIKPLDHLEKDSLNILEIIHSIKKINEIPIFIDFTLGTSHVKSKANLKNELSFRPCDIAAKLAQKKDLEYMVYQEHKIDQYYAYELISSFESAIKEN